MILELQIIHLNYGNLTCFFNIYKLSSFIMNLLWSDEEKAQLLEALQKFGSNDINSIVKMIPTKSSADIERAICSYERAAMRSIKNDDILGTKRQAPLDCWIDFFRENAPDSFASRDIVSALRFITLFEKRNDENLTLCYEYLVSLMQGKAPKLLPDDAMQILMAYFENLSGVVKAEDNSKEMDYIKNIKMEDVLQKTYRSKRGNIVGDPNLNVLKIPLNLLKINDLQDDKH